MRASNVAAASVWLALLCAPIACDSILDVENHDPVAGESGKREPAAAGGEMNVFRAPQAVEDISHFRRSGEFETHGHVPYATRQTPEAAAIGV